MYFLDTNTLIYFFKGMGQVSDTLFLHAPKDIGIPSVILYELYVGIAKSNSPQKRVAQLQEFLQHVKIIEFGEKEAKASASIRAELEQKGMPIGPIDTLIAGYAVANQATLITHNTKEFQRVHNLLLEDWF